MSENILEVKNVVRAFPVSGSEDFIAVNDVSISVPKGSLTILRGRSGSGKTTLINMLGALDYPTKGEILFEGEDITKWNDNKREKLRREKIGFVFQSVSLIPMMTALEYV